MTTFRNVLNLCGLSQQGAADFLDVSLSSIKHWSRGKNPVPDGIWTMLAQRYDDIQNAAELCLEVIEQEPLKDQYFQNISYDPSEELDGVSLPDEAARELAGAAALLMAVKNQEA